MTHQLTSAVLRRPALRLLIALLSLLPAAPAFSQDGPAAGLGLEQPDPATLAERGGGGQAVDLGPSSRWLPPLAARQGKIKSLAATYEIQRLQRETSRTRIESGTVKMRFLDNKPSLERWEGEDDRGPVLRIVRDGTVRVWVGQRIDDHHDVNDRQKVNAAMFRFPLIPPQADTIYDISAAPLAEPSSQYDNAPGTIPFPTVVNFIPKTDDRPSPWLRRLELHWDPKLAVAFRARWFEVGGSRTTVDLYDIMPDAPVEDSAFVPPALPAPQGGGLPAEAPGGAKAGASPAAPAGDPKPKDGDAPATPKKPDAKAR